MKKNVMMRVASVMLVLVLMTSSVISGTFAKYVTTNNGSDKARVATWGVDVTVAGTTFADAYIDEKVAYSEASTVLSAIEGDDVVAPGTEGKMAAFDIKGKPEVDVKVTYAAELNLANWEIKDTAVYCPIIITVVRTENATGTTNTEVFKMGGAIDTTAKLEEAVEAYINNAAVTYTAGTDLSAVNDDIVISWEWPYESGNDPADTALGDQAADTGDGIDAATIEFKLAVTVTQVD